MTELEIEIRWIRTRTDPFGGDGPVFDAAMRILKAHGYKFDYNKTTGLYRKI